MRRMYSLVEPHNRVFILICPSACSASHTSHECDVNQLRTLPRGRLDKAGLMLHGTIKLMLQARLLQIILFLGIKES